MFISEQFVQAEIDYRRERARQALTTTEVIRQARRLRRRNRRARSRHGAARPSTASGTVARSTR